MTTANDFFRVKAVAVTWDEEAMKELRISGNHCILLMQSFAEHYHKEQMLPELQNYEAYRLGIDGKPLDFKFPILQDYLKQFKKGE